MRPRAECSLPVGRVSSGVFSLPWGGRGLAVTVAAALLALAAACATDFTPRSVLTDLRVLALVTSPLEVGPAESVTIRPVTLAGPGTSIADERWSFCPLTTGASAGYACVVPACEFPLDRAADGSVTLVPGALAQRCLATAAGGGPPPPGLPTQIPDKVDAVVRYRVTASDGQVRESVQVVPLYTQGPPPARNAPPVVTGVEIGGVTVAAGAPAPALTRGGTLEVRVTLDPASAEPYVDDAGNALAEALIVSFYTTAGRFDFDRASGPDARVKLTDEEIAPGTTEAQVLAVARDGRGGQSVVGPFRVAVGP
jgi:hypothetical protein